MIKVTNTGLMSIGGDLGIRVIRKNGSTFAWKVRNAFRWGFVKGWLAKHIIAPFAASWGLMTGIADLSVKIVRKDGSVEDLGVVGYRVITDAGVAFLVDDWDNNGQDISTMNFHGCGTGTTAEAVGDTALQTESTTALNPDSTRATGVRSQPAANQYRSVGTLTFDAAAAVTEHGLLSQSATGGGSLWDRTVFSAINVGSGDSIQFTYTVTFTSGG